MTTPEATAEKPFSMSRHQWVDLYGGVTLAEIDQTRPEVADAVRQIHGLRMYALNHGASQGISVEKDGHTVEYQGYSLSRKTESGDIVHVFAGTQPIVDGESAQVGTDSYLLAGRYMPLLRVTTFHPQTLQTHFAMVDGNGHTIVPNVPLAQATPRAMKEMKTTLSLANSAVQQPRQTQ